MAQCNQQVLHGMAQSNQQVMASMGTMVQTLQAMQATQHTMVQEVRQVAGVTAAMTGALTTLPDASMAQATSVDGVAPDETEGLSPQWTAEQRMAMAAAWRTNQGAGA